MHKGEQTRQFNSCIFCSFLLNFYFNQIRWVFLKQCLVLQLAHSTWFLLFFFFCRKSHHGTQQPFDIIHSTVLPPSCGRHAYGQCSICPLSHKLKEFVNPRSRKMVHLKSFPSQEVVYTIQCPCPRLYKYVGKTQWALNIQVEQHHYERLPHCKPHPRLWTLGHRNKILGYTVVKIFQ